MNTVLTTAVVLAISFVALTQSRAVEKDTIECQLCTFMGSNIDKIEDLTFPELEAALIESCDKWNISSMQALCIAYAESHLEDIYMWMAMHPDDVKPINVALMCQQLGSCP
uniref:Saposin B-type domain-containing protein n=1 Tax=Plectus sambesii TaxID=2011161 RepID=A0A914VG00_9BILA